MKHSLIYCNKLQNVLQNLHKGTYVKNKIQTNLEISYPWTNEIVYIVYNGRGEGCCKQVVSVHLLLQQTGLVN